MQTSNDEALCTEGIEGKEASQVFHPWRRFLARGIDYSIYELLWYIFLAAVFRVNLQTRVGLGALLLDIFAALILTMIFEPPLLRVFGTTPGKAIFGLRLSAADGGRLSYGECVSRTWGVLGKGYGYHIPIYALVRAWKSYKTCKNREALPWDEDLDTSYTIKDTKWYRTVIYIAAAAAFVFAMVVLFAAQLLPPNRGDITVKEFAENYNYYAKYLGIYTGSEYLDDNGQWAQRETYNTGVIEIGPGVDDTSDFNFTVEDGHIQEISFHIGGRSIDGRFVSYPLYKMIVTSLAFIGAREDVKLFSNIPATVNNEIFNLILNESAQNASFTAAGVTVSWEVMQADLSNMPEWYTGGSGYEVDHILLFSMKK